MSTAKITRCRHYFHGVCLRKWLYVQDRCPLCHEIIMNQEPAATEKQQPQQPPPAHPPPAGNAAATPTPVPVPAAPVAADAANGGPSNVANEPEVSRANISGMYSKPF